MAKKIFSNPVVVTVSLAELALVACTVKTGDARPPNDNPPPPIQEPAPQEPEIATNPPAPEQPEPEPDPKPETGPTSTTSIIKNDDGTCFEVVNIDCPPGVSCNPPPPKSVPCPKDEPAGA